MEETCPVILSCAHLPGEAGASGIHCCPDTVLGNFWDSSCKKQGCKLQNATTGEWACTLASPEGFLHYFSRILALSFLRAQGTHMFHIIFKADICKETPRRFKSSSNQIRSDQDLYESISFSPFCNISSHDTSLVSPLDLNHGHMTSNNGINKKHENSKSEHTTFFCNLKMFF